MDPLGNHSPEQKSDMTVQGLDSPPSQNGAGPASAGAHPVLQNPAGPAGHAQQQPGSYDKAAAWAHQHAVSGSMVAHSTGLGLHSRHLTHPPHHGSDGAATIVVREDEPEKDEVGSAITAIELDAQRPIGKYFEKWRGGIDTPPPIPHPVDLFCGWLGALLGILFVSLIDDALFKAYSQPWLVASFGASAVLIYGVPESKLAQPRNLVGGQVISAIVGVCVRLAFQSVTGIKWLVQALGMSLALLAMQVTRTTHPPGGATALIACSSVSLPPWEGFQLVVAVALGSVVMMIVAVVVNNVPKDRAFPTYWWSGKRKQTNT